MFYEDMVADPATCVRRVASFLEKTLTTDRSQEIRRRCSREYMIGDERFLSKWDGQYLHVNGTAPKVIPENVTDL